MGTTNWHNDRQREARCSTNAEPRPDKFIAFQYTDRANVVTAEHVVPKTRFRKETDNNFRKTDLVNLSNG